MSDKMFDLHVYLRKKKTLQQFSNYFADYNLAAFMYLERIF
jgi:hypothetical protein